LSTFWQAIQSYQAESDTELNLSAGDYIVVRKVVLSHTRQNSLLLSLAQVHGPFRNLLIAHVTYLLQPASQRLVAHFMSASITLYSNLITEFS